MGANTGERAIRIAIILTTLLAAAGLTASGTTQLLAAKLFPLEDGGPAGPGKKPSAPGDSDGRERPNAIARRVLTRNIFDSETGSIAWNPPPPPPSTTESEPGQETFVLDGEPDDCEGGARLVAAMVVPSRPDLSFASIEEGGAAMLYRAGMQVGEAQLVGIREQRVFLQPSGQPLCQIVMFKPPSTATPRPARTEDKPAPARPSRSRSGSMSDDELDQGITKNSDTSYTITRELVDKVLGNQAELMRSARVIPYEENGRTIGVKVYGIRRNSVLGRLGMQNGDVLRTLNGHDLTSPDSALEAYTRLRSADQISLSMMRRGQPSSLDYSIR